MFKEKAVDYFDRHKESQECHITSDGRVFHSKGTADSFANTLKDNTVSSFTRKQVEAKEDAPATDSQEPGKDDAKVAALESLKNFDAATATYDEAKALVKALALETPSQSKVDLFAAIEAQKEIINTEVKQ